MKAKWFKVCSISVLLAGSAEAALTTNSWNDGSSKWELGLNWDHGVPSSANAINFISGGIPVGSRTITIDVATVNSNVINNCMTISNLTVSGITIAPNTLFLNNANNTPGNIGLTILNTLTLSSHGFLSITNSRLRVGLPGGSLYSDSFITLNTGSVVCSNCIAVIGNKGGGTLNIQDGTWSDNGLSFTYLGFNSGSAGTLNMSGGTATFSFGGLNLGYNTNTLGTVWLTGGQLITDEANIGYGGTGQMTVSNGTWQSGPVEVGLFFGSQGTLTVAGGNNVLSQYLAIGDDVQTTGTVWLTGGQLTVNNNVTSIGDVAAGQMTVSNGTWLANSVFAGNFAGSVGTLTVAGGTSTFSSDLVAGMQAGSTGAVWVTGGLLTVTNGATLVSSNGVGQMTVSNGTWRAFDAFVGFRPGSQGTLTVDGGTNLFSFILEAGFNAGATGTIWMSGGQLLVTNTGNGIALGDSGVGQMTISNGTCQTPVLYLGYTSSSQGTLTMNGGSLTVGPGGITIGNGPSTSGTVWLADGQLSATNSKSIIGASGVGRFTMSNGTWRASNVFVAEFDGSEGTLTAAGGSASMTNLTLGDCAVNAQGFLVVRGGDVYVTNATHTAVLDVRDGWVVLTGGLLMVDKLVMTNGCGLFLHAGGILSVGSVVLDPNLDADGDGLPNGWEQLYGLDPLSSVGDNGADGDLDGDGIPNWQEYLDGTNPILGPRTFHILSIAPLGNTMQITWTTLAGTTNVVQASPGAADGSYTTNGFADLGSPSVIIGSGAVTNNYFDIGGATNFPAHYYRVRLVP